MKSILIVLFFILTPVANGQTLTFTIFNKTSHDIDSVRLCKGQFFKIKAGEQLKVETCKSVSMQDGLPFGLPGGVIYGRTRNKELLGLCGTGVTTIDHGHFLVDITMREDEFGYRLFWTFHE